MDPDKLAFWGIALKPGEPADLDLQDGENLHVTMASYGVDLADEKGRSVVTATVSEQEQKHGLVVLNAGQTESRVMDVSFIGAESITFEVSGKNVVHLVGNFSFENDVSDSDESDEEGQALIGVYDEDHEMDSDSEEQEDTPDPRLLVSNEPPVITEVTEEDEKNEKALAVKKKNKEKKEKLPNGKHKAEPKGKEERHKTEPKGKEENHTDKVHKKDEPKQTKKTISFKEQDESEEEEEESSDEESSDDVEPAKKAAVAKRDIAKDEDENDDVDKIVAKPDSKVLMQTDDSDEDEDKEEADEVTPVKRDDAKNSPKSAKNKRSRKRKSNIPAEEPTPPTTKKSKVSQRPGTPAAVKSGQRMPKEESANKASAKKPDQVLANGSPSSGPSTPAQEKPQATGDKPGSSSKSAKKKRRKARKGGDKSA